MQEGSAGRTLKELARHIGKRGLTVVIKEVDGRPEEAAQAYARALLTLRSSDDDMKVTYAIEAVRTYLVWWLRQGRSRTKLVELATGGDDGPDGEPNDSN